MIRKRPNDRSILGLFLVIFQSLSVALLNDFFDRSLHALFLLLFLGSSENWDIKEFTQCSGNEVSDIVIHQTMDQATDPHQDEYGIEVAFCIVCFRHIPNEEEHTHH